MQAVFQAENAWYPAVSLPYRRSTEPFRRRHRDGISQEQLRRNCRIGTATIERWFHNHLELRERMFSGRPCPEVLGIDEHFFSKKDDYATTFCDLKKHRVFELAMGRSEKALEPFLKRLKGRERVKVKQCQPLIRRLVDWI